MPSPKGSGAETVSRGVLCGAISEPSLCMLKPTVTIVTAEAKNTTNNRTAAFQFTFTHHL